MFDSNNLEHRDRTKSSTPVQKLAFKKLDGKLLIAEDNPVNQELISEMMKLMNLDFHLVENGEEAFDALNEYQFDALLMDCQMPVMDGFEATRQIREFEKNQNGSKRIPIIALTANALEGDRERCLECGMDDYLSKPVSTQKLHEMLSQWLKADKIADAKEHSQTDKAALSVVPNSNMDASVEQDPSTSDELLEPPLDPAIFSPLVEMSAQASEGFLTRLISKYVESSATDIAELEIKVNEENAEEIRQLAHRLKSSSANLGATHLAALCQGLESASGSNNLVGLDVQLHNIKLERERVIEALTVQCSKAA